MVEQLSNFQTTVTLHDEDKLSAYVVFDLETTSKSADNAEIIELACIKANGDERSWFVETENPISKETFAFTGISEDDYKAKKVKPHEALSEFQEFVGASPLAGHNIYRYDLTVLARAAAKANIDLRLDKNAAIDTQRWVQLRHPLVERATHQDRNLLGYSLTHLHTFYTGQGFEKAHHAAEDCKATWRVLRALLKDEPSSNVQKLWKYFRLPESAFYEVEPFTREELASALKVEAGAERVYEGGQPFPSPATLFPSWLGTYIEENELSSKDIKPLLERVMRDEVPNLPHGARETADAMLKLNLGYRQAQGEMVRLVERALNGNSKPHMIQAPTGTGKTKGYLYPAQHYLSHHSQERVIIATHTKVLQQQSLEELKAISKHFAVSGTVVKSTREYLCLDALSDAVKSFEPHRDLREMEGAAQAVLAALAFDKQYDMEAIPHYWNGSLPYRELRLNTKTTPSRCRTTCTYFNHCAYQKDEDFRKKSSIWIANQAWLLAHYAPTSNTQADENVAAEPVHFIIDEAHNLEDVATQAFSETYAEDETHFHLNRLYDTKRERGILSETNLGAAEVFVRDERLKAELPTPVTLNSLGRHLREKILPEVGTALEHYSSELRKFLREAGKGDDEFGIEVVVETSLERRPAWGKVRHAESQWLKRLEALLSALRAIPKQSTQVGSPTLSELVKPTLDYLNSQKQFLYDRRTSEQENEVHLLRLVTVDRKTLWQHVAQPIDLARKLKPVWDKAKSVVLTSATLAPGGNFDYLAMILGLDNPVTKDLPASLPYEKAHVFVPTHLPEARASSMKRFQTLYHEELKTLLPNVERSLSLFTSSQRMKDAGKALEALEHVLVPQTRRERDDVAKQMLDKTRRAAALGTRAFMEGVDFPNLRLVNLEKIPFPVLTTLLQKRQQVIKDNGGDAWEDYYLPKAMLTFIQAFGRLIRDDRSEAKEGAFVLWDKRILNASYAFTLLEALPQAHNLKSRFHPSRKRGEFYERLVQTLGLEWSDFPKEDLVDESQKRLECIRSAYSQDKDLQAAVTALGLEFWEKDLTSDQERWPKQCEAIEKAMNGEDILVTLPTGFGKSMIFQLPALLQGGLTLVVSPLVALMNDQVTTFDNRGAPIRAINGSLPKSEQLSILQEVQDGNINLLYVSPERLLKNRDLEETLKQLQSKGTFRRVVLDEAHCLSMQGHDFRPDYRKVLFKLKSIFEHIPVSCLTATATREVLNDLNQYVGLETDKPVTASLDRTNIEYWCYKVGPGNADIEKIKQILTILDWLKRENKEPWTAIIYAGTQAATERLASLLISFDYRAEAYHAGRHARIRNDIQENFKEGKLQVIVATNAFGMGVDQPNVRAVIHYSPSFNVPAYVQEAGRAGRDGKQAYAILLHAPSDWRLLNWINDKSKPSERLAEKLRELLAERNGFYIGLPSKLVDTLKEEVSTDERLNANELLWLLDTLMQAGTLDYAYRVGSVRLLAHSWNDFQPYLSAEQTTFLERSGFKPGSKACTIDLTMLEPEEADSLCDALYKASRDSFGVAGSFGVVFRTYEPSLEIRLLDKVRRQEEFKEVIGKRLRKRATDLQTLRDYAEKHVCRRKRLLKFFDQEPEMNDAEHCCDVCNRESLSREPWEVGQLPFTEEMITFKYRPDRTVLEYLAWHQENWKSEKQYEGIGATRLKMVLRGQAVKPRKPEAIKLSYTDKNTRFFGRLEFVSERELGKALVACVKRGHVEQQAREYTSKQKGMSYRITALGLESLRNG